MRTAKPARLLRLHLSERDRHEGKPLYEAIVNRCRELHIGGATVFRGLEGYGESAGMDRRPIVVTIVDTPESIERLIPELESMIGSGVMAVSEVEAIRIENSG